MSAIDDCLLEHGLLHGNRLVSCSRYFSYFFHLSFSLFSSTPSRLSYGPAEIGKPRIQCVQQLDGQREKIFPFGSRDGGRILESLNVSQSERVQGMAFVVGKSTGGIFL